MKLIDLTSKVINTELLPSKVIFLSPEIKETYRKQKMSNNLQLHYFKHVRFYGIHVVTNSDWHVFVHVFMTIAREDN